MPSLSIKDVPEPLLIAIRQRAARNHRSLQGELMALLEEAAGVSDSADAWASAGQQGAKVTGKPAKSFAEAAAAFRRRFPAAMAGASESSTAIIREMRDSHFGEAWVMTGAQDQPWPPQPENSVPIPRVDSPAGQRSPMEKGREK